MRFPVWRLSVLLAFSCQPQAVTPDGGPVDASVLLSDAGALDAGAFDAGAFDGGAFDGGAFDAGAGDAGAGDAGAGDAGAGDAGAGDAGAGDAGTPDAGAAADCTSLGLVGGPASSFCWAHPRPHGAAALDLGQAAGQWLVVADDQGVLQSSDGVTWAQRSMGKQFSSVFHDGTQWIAAGDGVFTSPDGASWTQRSAQAFTRVQRVANTWVGIDYGAGISSSTDGVTWTLRSSAAGFSPTSMLFTNGLWIVTGVTSNNYGALMTSPDGITWTQRAPATWVNGSLQGLAEGNGLLVAWGRSAIGATAFLYTSVDGLTWTSRGTLSQRVLHLAFSNGRWVAAGSSGLLTSTDGLAWSGVPGAPLLSRLCAGPQGWLGGDANGFFWTSADGLTWSPPGAAALTSVQLRHVVFGGGLWVAVGGAETVLTSPDARTWTLRHQGGVSLASVAYGAGRWVAVGSNRVLTSTDGISWQAVSGTFPSFQDVGFGDGLWLAVGLAGQRHSSSDGLTWVSRPGNPNENFSAVAWSGSLWALVGTTVSTSVDGLTWAQRATPTRPKVDVEWGNGRWVAVSSGDNYARGPDETLTSTDGVTWVVSQQPVCEAVGAGSGQWLGLGGGTTTTDGVTWLPSRGLGTSRARHLAFGDGRWVVVGDGAKILVTPGSTF
ncbi:MAG: hypothetical protein Q8L48_27275 [Archangium sp.]|nr:hypothetical protein [Archangium sp.]